MECSGPSMVHWVTTTWQGRNLAQIKDLVLFINNLVFRSFKSSSAFLTKGKEAETSKVVCDMLSAPAPTPCYIRGLASYSVHMTATWI